MSSTRKTNIVIPKTTNTMVNIFKQIFLFLLIAFLIVLLYINLTSIYNCMAEKNNKVVKEYTDNKGNTFYSEKDILPNGDRVHKQKIVSIDGSVYMKQTTIKTNGDIIVSEKMEYPTNDVELKNVVQTSDGSVQTQVVIVKSDGSAIQEIVVTNPEGISQSQVQTQNTEGETKVGAIVTTDSEGNVITQSDVSNTVVTEEVNTGTEPTNPSEIVELETSVPFTNKEYYSEDLPKQNAILGEDYEQYLKDISLEPSIIENHMKNVKDQKNITSTASFNPTRSDTQDIVTTVGLTRNAFIPVSKFATSVPSTDPEQGPAPKRFYWQ